MNNQASAASSPAQPTSPPGAVQSEAHIPNQRRWLRIFLLALVPYLALVYQFNFVCDDAYISFRYSQNLVAGDGLVFNVPAPGVSAASDPNAFEPVEGYSNLLWVLLMALCEAIGIAAPLAARIVSVLCGVGLLALVTRASCRWFQSSWTCWLAPMFFATFPPLGLWATGGLATMPMALCVFAILIQLARYFEGDNQPRSNFPLWPSLATALVLVLVRADGMLWLAMLLGSFGLLALFQAPELRNALVKRLFAIGLLSALAVGCHFAFRYQYYGDWLPNTARAKVHMQELTVELREQYFRRGGYYLITFGLAFLSVFAALLLGLLGLIGLLKPLRHTNQQRGTLSILAVAWLLVLGNCAYARHVSGDFMTMGRFLVPSMPLLALLFAAGCERLMSGKAPTSRVAQTGLISLAIATFTLSLLPAFNVHLVSKETRFRYNFRWNAKSLKNFRSEQEMWQFMKENADRWTYLGRAIARVTEPSETIWRGPIGALSYFSGRTLYDSYGLTRRVRNLQPIHSLNSPGHDRRLLPPVQKLTYAEVYLAPLEDPFQGRPNKAALQADTHEQYSTVVIPLEPHEVPPNTPTPLNAVVLYKVRDSFKKKQP